MYDDFVASMPPPIRHLAFKYFVPDYENVGRADEGRSYVGEEAKAEEGGLLWRSILLPVRASFFRSIDGAGSCI